VAGGGGGGGGAVSVFVSFPHKIVDFIMSLINVFIAPNLKVLIDQSCRVYS